MDPKISFRASARKRRMNHDAAVSLYIKLKHYFSVFLSLILMFESSLDIYRPTEFRQRIPSGNAFSELGSIGTPRTTNGNALDTKCCICLKKTTITTNNEIY